jgi:hypothetical protein
MSGEETATDTPEIEGTPKAEEGATPDELLGDAGKKALVAERAARSKAEKETAKLAAQLKVIEDRDKTEVEKAEGRVADAERRATETEARANRAEIAATSGIPVDVLAGPKSSSAEDIAAFAATVATYATEASKKTPNGPVIPGQGKQPASAVENADDWLRAGARG